MQQTKPRFPCRDPAYIKANPTPSRADKNYERNRNLKHQYGITLEAALKILHDQNYICPICGKALPELGKTVHLDHDHRTGKVRNWLCGPCNRGLGFFKDSSQLLESALNYINNHATPTV